MSEIKLLAVDLGASSGRVMQAIFDGQRLQLTEVHRFKNEPVSLNDGLYWNILNLFEEIKIGIKKAANDQIPIQSISVDTWGVDYAFLDYNGDLLGQPHCYRDNRTGQYEAEFYQLIEPLQLFEETGVQPATINTILQLYADLREKPYLREVAHRVLFMPDLINYFLSGIAHSEETIASTSGLLNVHSRKWDISLLERLGIPVHWFGEMSSGGKILRNLSPRITQALQIESFSVIAGAGHDTAAAVLTVPYDANSPTAFISCGTWSLVGIESHTPIVTRAAFQAGITNEGCFEGHYRLLKNTTGLWLLQELQRDWRLRGEEISFAEMVKLANEVTHNQSWINPNDAIFASPLDMEAKILDWCRTTKQVIPQTKGEIIRVVLESLALAYRQTLEALVELTGEPIETIHMVGGGIQNHLLCQLTADYTGKQVLAGPIEASALGNVLAQLWSQNLVKSRAQCRQIIADSQEEICYEPRTTESVEQAYARFKELTKGAMVC